MNSAQAIVLSVLITIVCAKQDHGPGKQDWGFVDVREGAHMFYWLYFTTANVRQYTERPLVIWLQGGPAMSSTGYGNFKELGPLDINGKERNSTWVKEANILFIDNPVGTGFSYVDNNSLLSSNNSQIALDLVEFMKKFYYNHKDFVNVPLHIFGESYAGKMIPEFALELYNAIQRKEIQCKMSSVGLGDPWVSPIDSLMSWAPYLLNMGIIDDDSYNKIMPSVKKTLEFTQNKKWKDAYYQHLEVRNQVIMFSNNIDRNNVGNPVKVQGDEFTRYQEELEHLRKVMQLRVAKALKIGNKVKWGSQSDEVFQKLEGEIMKPVIDIVSDLLNKTDLKVGVYCGQFDALIPSVGTANWIKKLQWKYRNQYVTATRKAFHVNGIYEGFYKSGGKLTMFWVNRAGHSVPADNVNAMKFILDKFLFNR